MNKLGLQLVSVCAFLFGTLPASAADFALPEPDTVRTDTLVDGGVLKNLVVDGQRVLRYPDKDVWIISRSMRKHASKVVELLGNVPGMFYDRMDKKLFYGSSDNIKILMDGKEKEAGFVENMGHLRFRRVEVILHPQGIYRDYDVLVNLISYEHYEGMELRLKNNTELKPKQDEKLATTMPEATFMYTRDKVNIAAHYYYFYYARQLYSTDIRRVYPDYTLQTFRGDGPVNVNHTIYHNAYIDGDYDINKKHSVSFRYSYTNNRARMTDDFMVEKEFTDPSIDNTFRRELTYTRDHGDNHMATAYYRGEIEGWRLNSDFSYNYYTSDNSYRFDEAGGEQLFSAYSNKKHYTRFNLSAMKSFGKAVLSGGYINVYRYYKSTDGAAESSSKEFRHNAFASLQYSFCKVLRAGISGNADLIQSRYDGKSENQWLWAVNANMRYNIGGDFFNYISLAYGCNVVYPNQAQLNPIGYKTGYGVWVTGNPALKASKNHSLSLSGSQDLCKYIDLNYQVGVSYSGDNIQNVTARDETGRIVMTYRNMERLCPYGKVSLLGRYRFGSSSRWQNIMYMGTLGYSYTRYRLPESDLQADGGKWNGSIQASYFTDLSERISWGIGFKYTDNGIGYNVLSPQQRKKDELRTISLHTNLHVHNGISMSVSYKCPLKWGGRNISYQETVTPIYATYSTNDMFESNHIIEFELSWRFETGRETRKKGTSQYIETENNNLLK